MEIRGRWGFDVYCSIRSEVEMRSGQTPGKCLWKNLGSSCEGFVEM